MKLISGVVIFIFLMIVITPAFGLQQQSARFVYDLQLGESQTFSWKLVSDSDEDTLIKVSAHNPGNYLVSFPAEVTIPPRGSALIDITVTIPDKHDDNLIFKPMVMALQEGASESAATKINIAMSTILTINIGDNPVEFVPEPVKDKEESKVDDKKNEISKPVKEIKLKENESKGFTITQDSTPEPTPECRAGTEIVDGYCKVIASENEGGSCLIATAAYGTELAPQVQFLREIRDNTVLSTASGTAFMSGFNTLYYSFAPTVADMERENPMFQQTVRAFITPMISTLSIMSLADSGSEAEVLGLGLSVIMINVGMYIVAPIGIIVMIRRKANQISV